MDYIPSYGMKINHNSVWKISKVKAIKNKISTREQWPFQKPQSKLETSRLNTTSLQIRTNAALFRTVAPIRAINGQ